MNKEKKSSNQNSMTEHYLCLRIQPFAVRRLPVPPYSTFDPGSLLQQRVLSWHSSEAGAAGERSARQSFIAQMCVQR
ncbi:hypothetical protein KQX54_020741 [Cotesia glomerata]|uniref:Uncharacterized protein n=1 Tax=Cotesia glomerata TaxID=32391 RepID=A0AAV7J5W7_COTGL|nr:hypothetical protein KQX54_020741 [Cotesia glomerata]